jgi:hypothetical protein
MTPEDLKARTKKFAVDVIRFAKAIPKDHINDEIASQLTDSATSTAAHYRAVCRAKSRADPLWREADELTRILVRSRETARAKQQAAKAKKSTIKNRQSSRNR